MQLPSLESLCIFYFNKFRMLAKHYRNMLPLEPLWEADETLQTYATFISKC